MASGPAFQLQGERTSGQDVRTQNVTAVTAIANIVKTSLGPVGLDKVRVAVQAMHYLYIDWFLINNGMIADVGG